MASIFINGMLQGQRPYVYGDGNQRRCFTFVADAIAPLRQMAFDPVCNQEIINIGPDTELVTVNRVAELVAELLRVDLPPIRVPARPQEVYLATCCADKARRLLAYEPKVGLEDGLRTIIDWIRLRGPRPFRYDIELEITKPNTPRTWTERLLNVDLPTYCRPDCCAEVLESLRATGCSTPGVVVVNGRETEAEYRKLTLPALWSMVVLPENLGFAGALNATFDAHPDAPFYGFIADDEIALTPGWDRRLVGAAGSWRVANGNDGWQSRARVHGHVCIGGELARAVGCLAIRQCWHWYAFDDMWEAVDEAVGVRTFCEAVRVEHRHFLNGGAFDMTYVAGGLHKLEDQRAFTAWRAVALPDIVERIARARPSERLVVNGG